MNINKDLCKECGVCTYDCGLGAIQEGENGYFIDDEYCVDCKTCLSSCPMDAIS